jgi:hypothetical protein
LFHANILKQGTNVEFNNLTGSVNEPRTYGVPFKATF